jgi:fumarate hydratase class II
MPGKVNPVMAEMLNMAMFHTQGCDLTVSLASQAGQLELNVMMPIIAHNLFEMMQVVIGSVTAFTQKCVLSLQANRTKAEGWLARNAIVATALNPLIGYAGSAILVKEAIQRDLTIREVAHEKVASGELKHIKDGHSITKEEIDLALKDFRHLTYGGIASS